MCTVNTTIHAYIHRYGEHNVVVFVTLTTDHVFLFSYQPTLLYL